MRGTLVTVVAVTTLGLLPAAKAQNDGAGTRPVLMSLKPRHAHRMLSGDKWFEMRRIRPGWTAGTPVLVYASSPNHADDRGKPQRAVVGCFTSGAIQQGNPVQLWLSLGSAGGTGFDPLIRTLKGQQGNAIRVCEPRRLAHAVGLDRLRRDEPGFRPPQMYQYIKPAQRTLLATLQEGLRNGSGPQRGQTRQGDGQRSDSWSANRRMGNQQLFVYHAGYNSRIAEPLLGASYNRPAAVYRSLVDAGLATGQRLHQPQQASAQEIRQVHDPSYVDRVLTGNDNRASLPTKERKGREWRDQLVGPWSQARARHARLAAGGTFSAAKLALQHKTIVGNLAPGSHHVGKDAADGVETFNGPVFAARKLIREGTARRVMIVDGDLGYGGGTAKLTAGDSNLAYVSVYGVPTGQPVHGANQHALPVPLGASNSQYLAAFKGLSRRIDRFRPDLIIYNAGASAHHSDPTNQTARIGASRQGLAMRDALVFALARSRGVPVCWELGSGYGVRAAEIHKNTALQADKVLSQVRPGDSVRFDGGQRWRASGGVVHFPQWNAGRGDVLGPLPGAP